MGLHIDEAAVEKLLGAVTGELLDFIRWSAALIIALAWIAFGIFVGEDRSLRFQHRFRNAIYGGDQFDLIFLTFQFIADGRDDGGIAFGHIARRNTVRTAVLCEFCGWGCAQL